SYKNQRVVTIIIICVPSVYSKLAQSIVLKCKGNNICNIAQFNLIFQIGVLQCSTKICKGIGLPVYIFFVTYINFVLQTNITIRACYEIKPMIHIESFSKQYIFGIFKINFQD